LFLSDVIFAATVPTSSLVAMRGEGVLGVAGESNNIRIRNVYSSFVDGRYVFVDSDNKIGTLVSSRRFKEEIKPMDRASETLIEGLQKVSAQLEASKPAPRVVNNP
jgi:hypothetical protein